MKYKKTILYVLLLSLTAVPSKFIILISNEKGTLEIDL